MVLRNALNEVRRNNIALVRRTLVLHLKSSTSNETHRTGFEANLNQLLRDDGAIREDELASLVAQHNGYVQFTCHRGANDDCDYVDPPVVTVHEDGTWERV